MAVQDQLPTSNLSFTDMADTYGVARTADLGTMYKNGSINMFSLKKPTDMSGLFVEDPTGIDGDRSLTIPLWTDIYSTPPAWVYRRPTGGEASPYRGGDSAGYYRLARAFVTSGQVGTIAFEWSIRSLGTGAYGPVLTLTCNRPAHAGNLRPEHVKQHGAFLSEWYWAVLLKGTAMTYLFVAGELQMNGLTAYTTLGGGGYKIEASLTSEMVDDLKEGQAVFFLWLPGTSIGGLSFDQLQLLKGSGLMIGVYAGSDPGTGDRWLNPVPLALTRLTGNIAMTDDTLNVAYNAVSTTVHGNAAYPVKVAIASGNGDVIWSDRMDWGQEYTPDGISKNFAIPLQLVENPSRFSRSVTLTIYKATYASAAIASIPAADKATITVTQAARPVEIDFTPEELTVDGMMGQGDVFADCPTDAQWYIQAITETEEVPMLGGNYVSWVIQIMKLGSQQGEVGTPVEIPINPENSYMAGPANIRIFCSANTEIGAAPRTAYIHFSHGGGYSTLKVTQQSI